VALGTLWRPASVAFNAVIERGGGIRPAENVVILGGGPIGQAAGAISQTCRGRARDPFRTFKGARRDGAAIGATDGIEHPTKDSVADAVRKSPSYGPAIILEATGPAGQWYARMSERIIWEGRSSSVW